MLNITHLIFILLSITIGMLIGILLRPRNKYYGPNAIKESSKKYYDKINNKCIRFKINPLICPKSKSILQKILNI